MGVHVLRVSYTTGYRKRNVMGTIFRKEILFEIGVIEEMRNT